MTSHPFHKIIGGIFNEIDLPGCKVYKDSACDEKGHILPFFITEKKRGNVLCNVDIVIVKNGKVKVIIEIEESNVKPIHLCGKFLASSLAKFLSHNKVVDSPVSMDDTVLFIQILDTSALRKNNEGKYKSKKIEQWKNLENLIQNNVCVRGSRIDQYKLFYGDESDFELG